MTKPVFYYFKLFFETIKAIQVWFAWIEENFINLIAMFGLPNAQWHEYINLFDWMQNAFKWTLL